jgi:sulfotransferase family protein
LKSTAMSIPEGTKVFYCIGAQKSGTTWLQQVLESSPECLLNKRKELHYFDVWSRKVAPDFPMAMHIQFLKRVVDQLEPIEGERNLNALSKVDGTVKILKTYSQTIDEKSDHSLYVETLMNGWNGEKLVCDITPSYAVLERQHFQEMDELGDSRFLFILRDPVDRLWSQIRMIIRKRPNGSELSNDRFEAECIDLAEMYLQGQNLEKESRSNYQKTILELDAAVPTNRRLYLFYEDIFKEETLNKLCSFLNIQPVASLGKKLNPGRGVSLRQSLREKLYMNLEIQYEFANEYFGDLVPEGWSKERH